ncbi:MAG: hypothetical protein LAP85_08320 [Acidobacteriia bacterium]|nr:hypothetical protein [Terriglobia bacterium]
MCDLSGKTWERRQLALVIERILRHLKLWHPPERLPPPRVSTTLGTDADFLAWEAAGRLFDALD